MSTEAMAIKFLSSVVCVILLAVAYGENEGWSVEEENCIDELKLDQSKIQSLSNKAITPYSDSDFNNYLSCYWKRKGAQEENGEMNWDNVDKLLEEDFRKTSADWPDLTTLAVAIVAEQGVAECKSEHKQEDTHGKTVAKFLHCVSTKIQEAHKQSTDEGE